MNEMLEQLKIDPEFEKVIPPLTKDEYHQLEENILDDGRIIMPIAVWGDTIVDGHNRYRIACEYGDIPYSTTQLDFANRYEVIAWICKNQLGRRNLSDEQKTYLLGKRYSAEKQIEMLRDENGRFTPLGQNDPTGESVRTSERIAKEIGKSEKYVRRADEYARALDLADSVCPGVKKDILLGTINPTTKEVVALLKANENELPDMIDELRGIKKQDEDVPEEAESPRRPIEESIVDVSMIGLANMFIDGVNNYLTRFPKLRLDPEYIPRTLEVIEAVHDYLDDVKKDLLDALEESKTFGEGERKSQLNFPDNNEVLPQNDTDL